MTSIPICQRENMAEDENLNRIMTFFGHGIDFYWFAVICTFLRSIGSKRLAHASEMCLLFVDQSKRIMLLCIFWAVYSHSEHLQCEFQQLVVEDHRPVGQWPTIKEVWNGKSSSVIHSRRALLELFQDPLKMYCFKLSRSFQQEVAESKTFTDQFGSTKSTVFQLITFADRFYYGFLSKFVRCNFLRKQSCQTAEYDCVTIESIVCGRLVCFWLWTQDASIRFEPSSDRLK